MNKAEQAADVRCYEILAARDFFRGKKVGVDSKINAQVFLTGHVQVAGIVKFRTKTGQADRHRSQNPIAIKLPQVPPAFEGVRHIVARIVAENAQGLVHVGRPVYRPFE